MYDDLLNSIDDEVQKFLNRNGDIAHALRVINELIEKNEGEMIRLGLLYAKSILQEKLIEQLQAVWNEFLME